MSQAPSARFSAVHQKGHFGAALLAYAPLGFVVAVAGFRTLALAGGAVALALAMVPDTDTRLPFVDHRGPTHTVWFAAAVGLALAALAFALGLGRGPLAALSLAGFGFLVGFVTVCSHIAADAMTPMGVTPFRPFSDRHITYDVVPANHTVANYLLLAAGLAVAGGAFALATRL
jgi:inner membrane protein